VSLVGTPSFMDRQRAPAGSSQFKGVWNLVLVAEALPSRCDRADFLGVGGRWLL